MRFCYRDYLGRETHSGYETLLYDEQQRVGGAANCGCRRVFTRRLEFPHF
jgi:hypothetical protein